jgi:Skp family chaperone for outer membrane proteins
MRYALTVTAIVLIGVAAAGATEARAAAAEAPKIGIVNMQRVYEESKYKAEYEKKVQDLVTSIRLKRSETIQKIEKMRQGMILLTDEARKKKQAEINGEENKLKEYLVQAQQDVEAQKRTFLKEFEEKVTAIVEEVATEDGLNLVLNSVMVIFNNGTLDLTDAVLTKLNELFDSEHAETDTEPTEAGADGGD